MNTSQFGNSIAAPAEQTPSRRRLVRGALAASMDAAAIGAIGTAGAAPGADAELIRLCQEMTRLQKQIDALFEQPAETTEAWDAREEMISPIRDRIQMMVEKVDEMPVRTLPGLQALVAAAFSIEKELDVEAHPSGGLDLLIKVGRALHRREVLS